MKIFDFLGQYPSKMTKMTITQIIQKNPKLTPKHIKLISEAS